MTPFVIWVVRILVVLIVVRYLVRALRGAPRSARREAPRLGGTLVRDPQCGTYLPPARAVTLSDDGQLLHFCSTRCRDAWRARNRGDVPIAHARS
jgi:hypothetical protein